MYSHFTEIIYIQSFRPTSVEQFLRATGGSVSQAAVLISPQRKVNLLLSYCAYLKSTLLVTEEVPWTLWVTGAFVPAAALVPIHFLRGSRWIS